METMNISLPDPLKQFVDKRLSEGRHSSVSEYVRELIRADERKWAQDQLEAWLMEGMEGPSTPMTKEDWADIRKRGKARYEARHKEDHANQEEQKSNS